jgi:transcriptional regulator with GAF, ATPase, and Fis domain
MSSSQTLSRDAASNAARYASAVLLITSIHHELQNVIDRGVILAKGSMLRFDDLRPSNHTQLRPTTQAEEPKPPEIITEVEWRRRERNNIRVALDRAAGRIYGPDGAAKLLGIKPTTLISRLEALGLRGPSTRRKM